jgi:hypothetical protein
VLHDGVSALLTQAVEHKLVANLHAAAAGTQARVTAAQLVLREVLRDGVSTLLAQAVEHKLVANLHAAAAKTQAHLQQRSKPF